MVIRQRWFNVCLHLGEFPEHCQPWTSTSKRYSAGDEALLLYGDFMVCFLRQLLGCVIGHRLCPPASPRPT